MRNRRRNIVVSPVSTTAVERLEPRALLSAAPVYPTPAEQYMLELVNRARANPSSEASQDGISLNEGLAANTISSAAKQPLAFNLQLDAAATAHSQWMISHNTFSHNEGSVDPGAQMRAGGYPFTGSWAWGQNIAWQGSRPNTPSLYPTVAQEEKNFFVDSTEAGRGHRINLLNDSYKEAGIGVLTGSFQGYNSVVSTQDFVGESGNSFLTGVAFTDTAATRFYAPGEGLGNIKITATRTSDHAVFTTYTWAAGGYTLQLAPGSYSIAASGPGLGSVSGGTVTIGSRNVETDFIAPTAKTATVKAAEEILAPTTTTPQSSVSSTLVPQSGTIAGTVFFDRNRDGVRERGEPAMAKIRVYADLNGDGAYEAGEPSAVTNRRGTYQFVVSPGDSMIREVLKSSLVQSPTGNAPVTVNVAGGSLTDVSFGNETLNVAARQRVMQIRRRPSA